MAWIALTFVVLFVLTATSLNRKIKRAIDDLEDF